MGLKDIRTFATTHRSQAHLCICNTGLFDSCIGDGIYGFPHQGGGMTKSFWRAVASMNNIGPNDLIFIYRTSGEVEGCQEIHGPFKVFSKDKLPFTFYEKDSSLYPILIRDTTNCRVRFLFTKTAETCSSIADNYAIIKLFESKQIWGYRHPAVMNIGAARKKSVTSFTNAQTLKLLDLLEEHGIKRFDLKEAIPKQELIDLYLSLGSEHSSSYRLDDEFLINNYSKDEAYLYAYMLRGFKVNHSIFHRELIEDLTEANKSIGLVFKTTFINAMLEVIISPHLQDELDIVLMDKSDKIMLLLEIKDGAVDNASIVQTVKYLDLLEAIFPDRKIYANIIGRSLDPGASIPPQLTDRMVLLTCRREDSGLIKFDLVQ